MLVHRNLVSDSSFALVQDAIELLRLQGGRASVQEVADIVLQLPNLDPPVASAIISEFVGDDWRLRMTDDLKVELACDDVEGRALGEMDFIVVDVETTGPKTPPGRITEIGAYRVSQGRIVAEFQTLVNPKMTIPPFIVQLTGITDEMVRHAPVFDDVVSAWLDFAGTDVLVAHNASFDVRFINHEIGRVFPGRRMVNPDICTVSLSRRMIPDLINHRLHTLAEHFAVPIRNRHRAAGDAHATAEVFIYMLDLLHRHGVRDLAEARRFKINGHRNGHRYEARN